MEKGGDVVMKVPTTALMSVVLVLTAFSTMSRPTFDVNVTNFPLDEQGNLRVTPLERKTLSQLVFSGTVDLGSQLTVFDSNLTISTGSSEEISLGSLNKSDVISGIIISYTDLSLWVEVWWKGNVKVSEFGIEISEELSNIGLPFSFSTQVFDWANYAMHMTNLGAEDVTFKLTVLRLQHDQPEKEVSLGQMNLSGYDKVSLLIEFTGARFFPKPRLKLAWIDLNTSVKVSGGELDTNARKIDILAPVLEVSLIGKGIVSLRFAIYATT